MSFVTLFVLENPLRVEKMGPLSSHAFLLILICPDGLPLLIGYLFRTREPINRFKSFPTKGKTFFNGEE